MNNLSEKRKYPRIKKPYLTRYRIKPFDALNSVSEERDMVTVVNLGAGGIFFYARTSLDIGMALDLNVDISLSLSIIWDEKVLRAKRHLDTSIICYAIEFTGIE
ncbi:MAG: hypothetical protein HON76_13545 [Candidatus Scalindua sp.]|jgi:hypothetical protein|nr:hypothetical protein [Candidatus Scalindua sp.]MBT5305478.1 hypothetical protein [Candidatus Scalindua sp.]MBT6045254.1 hypothetical protein [Candidatus Scalindua sp.]MBT6226480.1 hypothetical protein [Candidatus Scalindua sp.]MBT6563541.1 hypothetical protein [Candidatus Scalindua sp.]